ncbi:hypothetical protein SBV1_1280003 [Verrucomicrobia bacterium]|nr:hypothetical protein SBV1_1280003 [Verrucomicrobiota bacterium]
MKSVFGFLRRFWKAGSFSPEAFVVRAAIITLLFGASELLGLREYTTFLSGTSANLSMSWHAAAILGLIHLLLYVGFILLVPVFLITASLLAGWHHWVARRASAKCPATP